MKGGALGWFLLIIIIIINSFISIDSRERARDGGGKGNFCSVCVDGLLEHACLDDFIANKRKNGDQKKEKKHRREQIPAPAHTHLHWVDLVLNWLE